MATTERLTDFPPKTTPVPADIIYVGNSADADNEVKSTIAEIIAAYPGLASIGALSAVADRMLYTTGTDTWALATITAFARTILDDADAAAVRTTIGAQASNAALSSIAGLTTVANNLIYTTASNTYAVIAPANNAVMISSGAGAPSWSATLPSAVQGNITALGTLGQALNMGTHLINNVVDPVSAQDAATKNYVDNAVANVQAPCNYSTTANLAGYTYANGASGVGATLTAGGVGAFTTDGATPAVNSRILVSFQSSTLENGVYKLTTAGDGGTAAVLTRATDYDQPSEINPGDQFLVLAGTLYGGTQWAETATVTTIGTDPITFAQITSAAALLKVNNLSDVASALTSRNNLAAFGILNIQVFDASGTYTPTSGMKYAWVRITGGGAGGGGCANNNAAAGGGGGAGGYAEEFYSAATIGASQTVTIGALGAGGTAGANAGSNGGNTTFGALMTANGGVGGGAGAGGATSDGSTGGAGGTATGGNVNISGGKGGGGFSLSVANTIGRGGDGGNNPLGFAGRGSTYGGALKQAPTAASGYGGGGGGASDLTTATAGADGTAGVCIVIEFI